MDGPPGPQLGRPRPLVLVVEDHQALRRLVEMTLEERDVEVVTCADAAQARAVLAQRRVDLLITDLMLPGEGGLDLVASLRRQRAGPHHDLPVVAFTAVANAAQQRRLGALGVRRVLIKPVPSATLLAAVDESLAPHTAGGIGGTGGSPAAAPSPAADRARVSTPLSDPGPTPPAFDGDRGLYLDFLVTCRSQFARDIGAGDEACARQDLEALQRLAHALKAVLLTLGHPDHSTAARVLEDSCGSRRRDAIGPQWARLRHVLERLRAGAG